MEKVRIGCVKYLNTLPLIEGLRSWRDCEVVTAAPSGLIGMLLRGEVDVALASVIDAVGGHGSGEPCHQEPPVPVLLPVGMIGCDGPTLTVRVFSRGPIEKMTRVHVDAESHTSVALLQVLMWRKYGVRIEVARYEAGSDGGTERRSDEGGGNAGASGSDGGRERQSDGGGGNAQAGWPEAVLLIGDKVVTDAPPAEMYPHQMDLGAAWKGLTGLPFVYAVWMCRGGEEETTRVRAAAAMLDRARRHNRTRLGWIAESRADEKHWPEDLAAEYLGRLLKYDVGDAEREAVEKFTGWARELGLCGAREARWCECAAV